MPVERKSFQRLISIRCQDLKGFQNRTSTVTRLPHCISYSEVFVPSRCVESRGTSGHGCLFPLGDVTPHNCVGLWGVSCYLSIFYLLFSPEKLSAQRCLCLIFQIQREHPFGCIFCRAFWLFALPSHLLLKRVCFLISVAGMYNI